MRKRKREEHRTHNSYSLSFLSRTIQFSLCSLFYAFLPEILLFLHLPLPSPRLSSSINFFFFFSFLSPLLLFLFFIMVGGDQFLDYARLAYSNVTICSSSTFCLWPALANNGDVYFPLTALVANSGSNATAKDLGPRFHWIRYY